MATEDKFVAPFHERSGVYEAIADLLSRLERKHWAFLLLLTLPLTYLALLYALPVLIILERSLFSYDVATQRTGAFSFENYIHFFSNSQYSKVLLTTIRIGVMVTVIDLIIGYPLAYLIARTRGAAKQVMIAVVVSPLLVSIVIRTFAWLLLLRSDGVVNKLLLATGVIDSPLRILYREPSVIIALVHVYLPFMIFPLANVIETIDTSLEHAASSLGANWIRRFFEIVLPLSVPGIAAGCMLVLTSTVSAYVTPTMLSGGRALVMPTLVAQQFLVLINWSFGSAISVVLMTVVLGMVAGFVTLTESSSQHASR